MGSLAQMMGGNNPIMQNLLQICGGKSDRQLENIARNMCKNAGVDVNDILKQVGFH